MFCDGVFELDFDQGGAFRILDADRQVSKFSARPSKALISPNLLKGMVPPRRFERRTP